MSEQDMNISDIQPKTSSKTMREKKYTGLFSELRLIQTKGPHGFGSEMLGEKYGFTKLSDDEYADYDDRNFERSAMRFSPYFDFIRNARKTTELYTKCGLYEERYCEEFPQPGGDLEIYDETVITVCPEYRKISLGCGIEITIYSRDRSVKLENVDSDITDLYLLRDTFLSSVDMPYIEYYISRGLEPLKIERTARIRHFDDTITENGGTLSLSYEISDHGSVVSVANLELKVIKLEKPKTEIYEEKINHSPTEINKQKDI